jgi:hypothetical protein
VEHAFRALKGCFQSHQELRIPVGSQKDLDYATNWVLCCIILHNMVIRFEEKRYGPKSAQRLASEAWARDEGGPVEGEDEGAGVDINDGRPGHAFLLRLMEQLLQS